MIRAALAAGLLTVAAAAGAAVQAEDEPVLPGEEAGPEVDPTLIIVTAGGRYDARSGDLRAAQRTFRKYRDRFAPNARLILHVSSPDRTPRELAGIPLTLVAGNERVPVELDDQNRFVLPEPGKGDWTIKTRTRGLTIQLVPMVFSPGSSLADWRYGDLLLQSRVASAVMLRSLNLPRRLAFDLAGGCGSDRVAVWQGVSGTLAGASVREGARSEELESTASGFRLPTDDGRFTNEARVGLTLE